MIKSHKGAAKLVSEVKGGDPAPTWQDKLKNQMGYAQMSDLATKVHGLGRKPGKEVDEQLLSDLGLKSTTESDRPEKAAGSKKIV